MKPKKGTGNNVPAGPIHVPGSFESKDPRLQGAIQELRTTTRIENLQRVLKVLPLDDLKPADVHLVASLLTYLFLTIESKHPIRKTISRMLSTQFNSELVKISMGWNVNSFVVACIEDADAFERHNELVLGLQHCFSNFPLGIEAISDTINSVTVFMIDYFSKLVDRLDDKAKRLELHAYTNNVTKLLVAILQQCQLSDNLPDYCSKLMTSSYKVITDEYINFDTKSNCGVLMVISVIHVPEKIPDGVEYKTNPCLSLLKFDQCNDNEVTSAFNYKEFSKNYTANLCIYSGILNVVPQNLLCEEAIDGVPVISFMFGKLLDCAKRCTGKSTQILEVSRSLILISKVINTIPLGYIEPMFSQGLEYVWTHLDHYIDTVRQSARTIFENLIRLAHEHYKKGYQTLLKLILTNMIDLLVNRCTHYVALTILSNETGCSFLLDQFSHLPFILLINMQNSAVAPQICNTYESLMAQHKEEERNVDKWLELWVDLIKPLLTRARMPLVAYYQRLLVSAYKLQPMVLKSIMHYQWYSGSNELGALLGCLRTARQSGLDVPLRNVTVLSPEQISEKYWRGIIEYEFLELMMCHQSDEVRIHILGLIVESQKTREIFTLWELAFVKKFFHYNVTTQSPNTRQQFIALYKKVFVRIRDTLAVLNRNINNVTNKIELTADERKTILSDELELLQDQDIDNRQFVMVMFQKYLCPGFHMESNYQRRATCLELVLFIITERCVEETEIKNMWKPEYTTFLLQVLSDSYESNVRMSFSILKRLPYAVSEHFNKNTGLLFLRQTIQNASSLKPDKVTAAGYMLQLYLMTPYAKEMFVELYRQPPQEDLYTMAMNVFLNRANMATTMAKADLFRSVRDEAFYGDLMCVRNILENNDLSHCKQWTSLAYQIVATCRKIGEVVAPIVNNNSPEGYIPLEKFNARCYAVSAQMVLVYAWRSVKEVCLLLGELTLRAPDVDPANNEEVLTVDLMTSIEEYFVQVFRETKHRGAYEQASVGFVRFCKFLWSQSPTSPYSSWPRKWLDNIFSILRGEDQQVLQRLCPNRRSAGLPFMVVDIVITEPREANNEIFHYCMRSLLEIITNESSLSLSRIHAMNILKSLYRHHLLGEVVTTYVAEGVQAALRAFGSDKWGVRNSAFILIAALMQRIFGVQRSKELEINHKNKMSTKVFFMRYPELYQCFLNYLIDGTVHNKNVVVLHPVLLILERLYPCNTEEETQLGKYIKYVTKCLENPIYNIRELAAQASASLIPNLEVVDYIKRLLIKLWDVTLSDNYCQGTISQIICLLKSLNKGHSQLNVPDIIEGTFWIPISAGRFVSHFTVANYYDMLTLLTTVFIKNCQGSNIFLHLVKILTWQAVNENRSDRILSTARKKLTVARFNLHTHVVQNLYICDHYFKSLYMKELVLQAFGSAHEEVVEYCFNYVSYMYFDHPKYCQSSLYETEVVEVSEKERNVVRAMDLGLKEYMLESCHRSMRFFYLRVFYRLLTKSHDTIRSMLLAMQHYPCIMDGLKSSRQKVLDFFLHWCEGERVELYCAALNCLSNYLCSLGQDDAKLLNCSQLYRVLMCAASDASPSHLKMAVAQFLVANRRMYMEPEFFKHPDDITALWKMVLQLLDDDDQDVRNTMSELAPKIQNTRDTSQQMSLRFDSDLSIISDKAKDEILESCTLVLPPRISIPLFVSWILNTLNARPSKGQTNSQMKELFDPGVDNTFYEQKQFEKLTLYWFKRLLWKLDGGLSYDDGTIFVEEHVLMVATVMYNILYHHLPPSVNASARVTLLCVVKKVKEFAERSGINSDNFAGELQAVIAREFANLGMKGNNHPNIAKLQEIAMGIFSIE